MERDPLMSSRTPKQSTKTPSSWTLWPAEEQKRSCRTRTYRLQVCWQIRCKQVRNLVSLGALSPLLLTFFHKALNLGIFNYVPKMSLPSKPPGSPPLDYSRSRTGSLFGHSFLGKSSNFRNSVFGDSTSSAVSRTDTLRSAASGSTAGESHVSSVFSPRLAPSTIASSTYSDTEDSPVMVSREPSHEDLYGIGPVPSPTKQWSRMPPPVPSKSSITPMSSVPRRVADESLLRAHRFGSSSSISQMLAKPEKMNMNLSNSDDDMGRSRSAEELRQSQAFVSI